MNRLPTGTVTFLFTDVESSTRLLREQPAAYPQLLAGHRQALREVFQRHGGVEVDAQGDALFTAFSRASDAVAAAEEGQRALVDGPVHVRMGLHTGEPVVTAEGYVGIDVHRAARIAAAGRGGQVLMSQSTRDLAGRDDVRDLGVRRLKDLSAPEKIYQLGDGEFPPLRTLFATNLPVPLTPFIGRELEVSEAGALLRRDGVRLVTLTGAGGSGKTRLALQVAGDAADRYPDGIWWVPLVAISEAADVMPAIGTALGGGSAAEAIGNRRMLLLLDNFEQVVEAAPDVAGLLGTCPHLDVVVTSRERLRVRGEHMYPVPVLARNEARELFLARARAIEPAFEAGDRLDELCLRLDDLPLAIELAAARVSLLSTDQLFERLGKRLDLVSGERDADTRHRTLRTTIQWSYDLLTPDERRLFAALSVFRGGWTLEAAERVADADLEVLQSLIDKSLVRRSESGRYTMLETIREFVTDQLRADDRDPVLSRLLDYLLELFATANLAEDTPGAPRTDIAQVERPNLDVALSWAAASGHAVDGLRLLIQTEMYWITNDPAGVRGRLDRLIESAGDNLEPVLRGHTFRLRAASFDLNNSYDLSEPVYRQALAAYEAAGDAGHVAQMKSRLASTVLRQGRIDLGVQMARESLEEARRQNNVDDEGFALWVLAEAAFQQGDVSRGAQLAHESAALSRQVGYMWFTGVTLLGTAERLIAAGRVDEAERDYTAAAEIIEAVSDHMNIPYAFAAGAAIASLRRDAVRAGMLWGALESIAQREPRSTTQDAIREYQPYVERVHGPEFDSGLARGRTLSLEEAFRYAITNHI
ncbi:MAG TPA: adenylate/guanylate cyclase domain-containing protein [Candidatus Dormibacteraeota bacterium]|nr:adenylate/guanylate cyclase domain-containing protein [Candidatus Dormibacteraeota bacterium]